MDCIELSQILDNGEDTKHQFKQDFNSIDKLAAEISAFANSQGGLIIVGVSDIGEIIGINKEEISRLNQWLSNATSQKIDPPIFVSTEILKCDDKRILIINIPLGTSKPYAVNKSEFWVKNGADKRRATREELFRLMQASSLISADEKIKRYGQKPVTSFLPDIKYLPNPIYLTLTLNFGIDLCIKFCYY